MRCLCGLPETLGVLPQTQQNCWMYVFYQIIDLSVVYRSPPHPKHLCKCSMNLFFCHLSMDSDGRTMFYLVSIHKSQTSSGNIVDIHITLWGMVNRSQSRKRSTACDKVKLQAARTFLSVNSLCWVKESVSRLFSTEWLRVMLSMCSALHGISMYEVYRISLWGVSRRK